MNEKIQSAVKFLRWYIEPKTEYGENRCKDIADLIERFAREKAQLEAKVDEQQERHYRMSNKLATQLRVNKELQTRIAELQARVEKLGASLKNSLRECDHCGVLMPPEEV